MLIGFLNSVNYLNTVIYEKKKIKVPFSTERVLTCPPHKGSSPCNKILLDRGRWTWPGIQLGGNPANTGNVELGYLIIQVVPS
jgi:hypothetical protein